MIQRQVLMSLTSRTSGCWAGQVRKLFKQGGGEREREKSGRIRSARYLSSIIRTGNNNKKKERLGQATAQASADNPLHSPTDNRR